MGISKHAFITVSTWIYFPKGLLLIAKMYIQTENLSFAFPGSLLWFSFPPSLPCPYVLLWKAAKPLSSGTLHQGDHILQRMNQAGCTTSSAAASLHACTDRHYSYTLGDFRLQDCQFSWIPVKHCHIFHSKRKKESTLRDINI